MQKNHVKLKIFGSDYSIKGSADAEYTRRIADFVDHAMHEVEKNSTAKSPLKVAVLTALNLADELFRERELRGAQTAEYEKNLMRLSELIENTEDNINS